ncbi:MAG: winged helix-turn-helix domain-containing protein [Bacteroidales bacterium]|nr:winged helix-turn-helix domain-containing protein [Bacteroidales bacterium]
MHKNDVEINADKIQTLLIDWGVLSIKEISEFTQCKKTLIYLYLGWLLRENKIRFYEEEEIVYVELTHPVTD